MAHRSQQPLCAISFDAGNTLFRERRSRAEIYCDCARAHGLRVEPRGVGARMQETLAEMPQWFRGSFRFTRPWFEEFIRRVFASASQGKLSTQFIDSLFDVFEAPSTFEVFEDVRPTLAGLLGLGLRLVVVSNWSESLPRLLDNLGLAHSFEAVLSSALEATEKPDPEIFQRAIARLGLQAGQILHVGDRPDLDLAGARQAGLRAVQIDRSLPSSDLPRSVIASLCDLLELHPLAK